MRTDKPVPTVHCSGATEVGVFGSVQHTHTSTEFSSTLLCEIGWPVIGSLRKVHTAEQIPEARIVAERVGRWNGQYDGGLA